MMPSINRWFAIVILLNYRFHTKDVVIEINKLRVHVSIDKVALVTFNYKTNGLQKSSQGCRILVLI